MEQNEFDDMERVIIPGNLPVRSSLAIDRNAEAVDFSAVADKLGISGPRIPAVNLVDKRFTILGAKSYDSSFDETKHVYFVTARDEQTHEVFTTSLGGQAIVDMLDDLVNAGFNRPLTVTLREVKGGKYGHYYVLE